MDKMYMVSLCYLGGLLGGGLVLEDERITYGTTKLQVPPEIRDLRLPYCRIKSVAKSRALFLPAVTIQMQDGQEWKFFILRRNDFLDSLKAAMDVYASGD